MDFVKIRVMSAAAATIVVRDLQVRRGGAAVLPGVSVEVRSGIVTGLLGPSGSGKTTLMRAIVGVQVVESGAATVLGLPAGSPELRRRVGYVTQEPSVYADLSVRENLRYFARIAGAPSGRVDEAIEIVDLGPHAEQLVHTLSGGERSRARSRPRCSPGRTCSFSTSRRSGSTRSCAATCGRRSTSWRRAERRCSSRAT